MLFVALIRAPANIGPIAIPAKRLAWKWPKATFLLSGAVQSDAYAKHRAILVVNEPHRPSAAYPSSSQFIETLSGKLPTIIVMSSPKKAPNVAQTMTGFLPIRSDSAPR